MRLDFLDRAAETHRLKRAFASSESTFCCLYGRRRCGKSRLLQEALPEGGSAYYVGDRREPKLQRQELAAAIRAVLPGFDSVIYPDWTSLLERWWGQASRGAVLALDEFPFMVESSPELPSILQKLIDSRSAAPRHLVLCGSSQRMMQGLVLDASAPLYGRAREVMALKPLLAGWTSEALKSKSSSEAIRAFAVWGGIPRYWELAREYGGLWEAVSDLVLDPMGVLHAEPDRLLADDVRDSTQAASILALVGRGCHRLSEIASRLGKPATSLTRPMARLQELGLIVREVPFDTAVRAGGRSLYKIEDPFLAFWFRFVEPNRSLLAAGALDSVISSVRAGFDSHAGHIWEKLARDYVPRSNVGGRSWGPASRWWGAGTDHQPLEVDVVAESIDGKALLVGEAKLNLGGRDLNGARQGLENSIACLPFSRRYGSIVPVLFAASAGRTAASDVIDGKAVLNLLR